MRIGGIARGIAATVVLAGCSAGDVTALPDAAGFDASPNDATTSDAAVKDASASDATTSDVVVAVPDAAPDSGTTITGSKPPSGSTMCGSGTFGPSDSMNVCQTSNPWFPPSYAVTKACGGAGFTFSSGLWEVWCTPSSVYLFARFDDAVGFEIVPPTGNFEAGNGGGSANAWFDTAKKRIIVEAPNAQPTAKSGKMYLLYFDGNTDAGTKFRMVGGAALSWK